MQNLHNSLLQLLNSGLDANRLQTEFDDIIRYEGTWIRDGLPGAPWVRQMVCSKCGTTGFRWCHDPIPASMSPVIDLPYYHSNQPRVQAIPYNERAARIRKANLTWTDHLDL